MFLLPREMVGWSHTWWTLVGSHRVLLAAVRVMRGHEVIGARQSWGESRGRDPHLHCCVCTQQLSQMLFLSECQFSGPLGFHLGQASWVCDEVKGWAIAASWVLGPVWTGFYLQAFCFWLSAWFSPRKEWNRSRLGHLSLWRSTLSSCKFVLRLLLADMCFAEREWVTWGSFYIQQATSPFNSPFPNRRSCDKEERQIPGSLEMLFSSLAPWEAL